MKEKHFFTPEQAEFIQENVYGRSNLNLLELFNKHFHLDLGINQIKAFKKNNKLSSGLTGQFEKGSVPFNKGTKGLTSANKTSFKKGQMPHNHRPIGSERIDKDGYTLVKISDHKDWHKRWRHKHKVVWEQANGRAIPKGYKILFGDGNRQNFDLDNLILVTNKQLLVMNHKKLIQKDADSTRTGVIIADIYSKLNELKK